MASNSSSFDSNDVTYDDLFEEHLSSSSEDCLSSLNEIQDLFDLPMNSQHNSHPSFTQAQGGQPTASQTRHHSDTQPKLPGHPGVHPHPISVQQHDYQMRKEGKLPVSSPSVVSRESADPRRRGVGPGPYPFPTCSDPHPSGQTHVQPDLYHGWRNCSSPEPSLSQEALNQRGHHRSAYREMEAVSSVTRTGNFTRPSYPCNSGPEYGAASMSGGYQLSYAPAQSSGQGSVPFENSFRGE